MQRKVAIGVGVLAVAGCIYFLLRPSCGNGVVQVPFDSLAWKSANPNQGPRRTVRSQMICDLLRRHDFQGWTRTQVIQLLGEPNQWSGFEQWDIVYVLGLERMEEMSLDDEAIGFKFDEKDRVIKYGLSVN